jgi:hypothetical protein
MSAYRLSVLILPGESELFYGLCHSAYGLALVIWAIVARSAIKSDDGQ